MRLTVLTDLTGPVITRQDLFNAWADASLPTLGQDDLGDTFLGLQIGSDFSNAPAAPNPGTLFYHQQRGLMYVWTDTLDDTGVSLWLSIGPDKFECAALAAEPIPAGAVVECWFDRWCKTANPESNPLNEASRPMYIGVNQSGLPDPTEPNPGTTTASGAWFALGIDGLLTTWFGHPDAGVSEAHFGAMPAIDKPFVGVLRPLPDRLRGAVGSRSSGQLGTTHTIGQVFHPVTNPSEAPVYHLVKWAGGFVNR